MERSIVNILDFTSLIVMSVITCEGEQEIL